MGCLLGKRMYICGANTESRTDGLFYFDLGYLPPSPSLSPPPSPSPPSHTLHPQHTHAQICLDTEKWYECEISSGVVPSPRFGASFIHLKDSQLLLFGGNSVSALDYQLSDCWIVDVGMLPSLATLHTTYNIQHNIQHTAHNIQHTTYSTQHTTYNIQHTTYNTQHTTHNTQHTTYNIQHTTHNTQHTTHNTQHTINQQQPTNDNNNNNNKLQQHTNV